MIHRNSRRMGDYDDSDEMEYELVPTLPNQKVFCLIFAYSWHYHTAVAKFSQLSIEALKFLEKGACTQLEELCSKDADFVQMFRLMGSLRPLGLRSANIKFDIQFPTRSQLKLFLTKLIMKRRKQLASGQIDLQAQNCISIISSTDSYGENTVSHACRNMVPMHETEQD